MADVTHGRPRNPRGEGSRLRRDLITCALDVLAEAGDPEAVTLRGVAKAAGVTPNSTYRHFTDRDALVAAACDACFEEFVVHMADATSVSDDPFERLLAAGSAYARYAREQPGHYRVLFSTRRAAGHDAIVDHSNATNGSKGVNGAAVPVVSGVSGVTDAAESASDMAFQQLIDLITACLDAGAAPATGNDPVYLAFQVWTWVHGLVDLRENHAHLEWPPMEQLIRDVAVSLGLDRPAT